MLKATCSDDSAGLSYQPFDRQGFAPCQRGLAVEGDRLLLMDRATRRAIPIPAGWGAVTGPPMPSSVPSVPDWLSVFKGASLPVSPEDAFGAVVFYPDDQQEIGELATQPFVADYLQDLLEQDRVLAARVAGAGRVCITGFDSAIVTCIGRDRPRDYTIFYDHPAFAQRQAQMLWNMLARAQRLEWLNHISMRPQAEDGDEEGRVYQLAYEWTPFGIYDAPPAIVQRMQRLAGRVTAGAVAFIVGPAAVGDGCRMAGLQLQAMMPVASLPTFRMHQSVLARAQLKPGVMLYQVAKS